MFAVVSGAKKEVDFGFLTQSQCYSYISNPCLVLTYQRVLSKDLEQLPDCLEYEEQRDQGGEDVLGELGEVLHQGGPLRNGARKTFFKKLFNFIEVHRVSDGEKKLKKTAAATSSKHGPEKIPADFDGTSRFDGNFRHVILLRGMHTWNAATVSAMMTIHTPIQTLRPRKSSPAFRANPKRASSNRRTGPVTPVMMSGMPEKRWKRTPATAETTMVSGMPMALSVFSAVMPPKAMAPDRHAK